MGRSKRCLFYITILHLAGVLEIKSMNLRHDVWNSICILCECDSGAAGPGLAGIHIHNPHTRLTLELGTAKSTAK
jgi:hypothetical protein